MKFPVKALEQHRRKRLPIPESKACANCGNVFQPRAKYPQQRFCCHRCQWQDRGGINYNIAVARATAKKRGNTQRGKGEGKSYTKLNGRHAHRVVAEQILGRLLQPGEIVHHKDEIKTNFSAENLQVLSRVGEMSGRGQHCRIHFSGKKQTQEQIAKRVAATKATKTLQKKLLSV